MSTTTKTESITLKNKYFMRLYEKSNINTLTFNEGNGILKKAEKKPNYIRITRPSVESRAHTESWLLQHLQKMSVFLTVNHGIYWKLKNLQVG